MRETPAESGPRAPDGAPRSRAARVLRRTWVGALIVAGLLALLWFANRSVDGTIVLAVGTGLSWLAVLEVSRMGGLKGRGLFLSLAPAAVALLLLNAVLVATHYGDGELHDPHLTGAELVASYALVLLVCTVSLLEVRHTAWKRPFLVSLFALLGLGLIALRGFDLAAVEIPWAGALAAVVGWLGALGLAVWSMRQEGGHQRVRLHLVMAVWLLVPLPALVHVWTNHGFYGLVALIALSKVGDIAGYYAGIAIGRVHPFPRLSPGKTLEGCLASVAAACLAGVGCVLLGWLPDFPFGWKGGLAAGLAINLAAQAGDLYESGVKRRAGVKDSGRLFGPSGGVLDVVDSLLFTVPAALVTWPLLFAA